MKQFFITVAGVVIGLTLFIGLLFFTLISAAGALASHGMNTVAGDRVLTLDLRGGLRDHGAGETLFGDAGPSTVEAVRAIAQAASDDDVAGIVIRTDGFGMVPAAGEEIADALRDFKRIAGDGKFTIAYAQGFEGTSPLPYMAVAPADEIWMQASSGFVVSGLQAESGFLGGVWDKIDADPEFVQFEEYKTAADTYDESAMTEAGREATTSWLTSVFDTSVTRIAADRDLTEAQVLAVFETSPHTAEAAMAAGFIDRLGYWETVKAYVRKRTGDEDIAFQSVMDYGVRPDFSAPVIAFIGGEGTVVTGDSTGPTPFGGDIAMGGDTLAKAFDDAREADNVRAIVFRVSSPGGSPAASDQIMAAVDRAREDGIPVIVSMGQYAASGGYYVSATADHITALPTTITGSIGVLGGKIAMQGAYAKLGYNVEQVRIGGEYTGVFSPDTPFNEVQSAGYTSQMENIYEDFTTLVARGRDMPIDDVLEIAKGRVWTGEQALERGLVDELGGIHTAIAAAKRLADIDADASVRLRRFPRALSRSEQFEQLFSVGLQASEDLAALRALADTPEGRALLDAHAATKARSEIRARIPQLR